MLLTDKNAVIYGAGGAIGGAIARAFAREGADAIPETATIAEVYSLHADALGITREQFQAFSSDMNPLKRLPTLAEVANVAAFMASDQSSAMTAAVANLSCGLIAD